MNIKGALSEHDAEYLKSIIRGLYSRLSVYNGLERENERQKREIAANLKQRMDLQDSIRETTEELQSEIAKQQQLHNEAIQQKEKVDHQYNELIVKFNEISTKMNAQEAQQNSLLQQNATYSEQLQNLENWEEYAKKIEFNLDECNAQREEIRQQYDDAIQKFDKEVTYANGQLLSFQQANEELYQKNAQLLKEIYEIRNERDNKLNLSQTLLKTVNEITTSYEQAQNKEAYLQESLGQSNEHREKLYQNLQNVSFQLKTMSESYDTLSKDQMELLSNYNDSQNQREELMSELNQSKQEIFSLQQDKGRLKAQVDKQEQEILSLQDERSSLQTSLSKLQSDFQSTQSAYDSLVLQNRKTAEENRDLYTQLQALQTNFDKISAQKDSLTQQVDNLTTKNQKIREEYAQTNNMLSTAQNERGQLRGQVASLTSELQTAIEQYQYIRKENEKLQKRVQQLINEREAFDSQIKDFNRRLSELEVQSSSLREDNYSLNEQLMQTIALKDDLGNQNAMLEANLESLTKQHRQIYQDYEQLHNQLEYQIKEREAIEEDLVTTSNRLADAISESEIIQTKLVEAKHQAQLHKSNFESLRDIDQISQKNQEQVNSLTILSQKLQQQVRSQAQQLIDQTESLKQFSTKWENQEVALNKTSQELREKLLTVSQQFEKAQQRDIQNSVEITKLEQHLCVQEDMSQVIDSLQAENSRYTEEKLQAIKELNSITNHMLNQSYRAKDINKAFIQVKELLQDRQNEVLILRETIAELQKQRKIYIPQREDPIDIAVADYVNNRTDPLPLHFIREDLGVYIFGTRRVFVKLENGKIIIRIGGGFMQIDEFVDIYSQIELERIESRQNDEKVAKRKAVLGKIADSFKDQRSSGDVSPSKAKELIRESVKSNGFNAFYAITRKPQSPSRSHKTPSRASPAVRKGRSNTNPKNS